MTVGDLWNRALNLGRRPSPLEADLRRITDSALIDVPPKDVLKSVTQATHNPDDRREILRHLQECLAESAGSRWRRVHGGLVLLEQLLRNGSPAVMAELAEGLHFDPVQRLTFLERFEYRDDRRVQGVIRQKATALRGDLLERLQEASGGDAPATSAATSSGSTGSCPASKSPGDKTVGASAAPAPSSRYVGFGSENTGVGSDSVGGTGGSSSSAYVGFGSDCVPESITNGQGHHNTKKALVNGLVKIGHRDDTDSENSDDGGNGASGGKKASRRRSSGGGGGDVARRKPLEDSTDSSDDDSRRRQREKRRESPPKAAPKAAQTDLLGGFDSPVARTPAPPPPSATEDLLGGMLDADAAAAPPAATEAGSGGGANLLDF